jgi:hypothetical protein
MVMAAEPPDLVLYDDPPEDLYCQMAVAPPCL